jgi:hypothetical protein
VITQVCDALTLVRLQGALEQFRSVAFSFSILVLFVVDVLRKMSCYPFLSFLICSLLAMLNAKVRAEFASVRVKALAWIIHEVSSQKSKDALKR